MDGYIQPYPPIMKHGNQKIPHVYTMEPQSENDGIFQPRKNRKVSIWKQVDSQVRWARTTEILMLFFPEITEHHLTTSYLCQLRIIIPLKST